MTGPPRSIYLILAVWLADTGAFQLQHQIQNPNPIVISRTSCFHRASTSQSQDRHPRLVPTTTVLHAATEEEATATTFTLSFGGVEFCLTPGDNNNNAANAADADVMCVSKISNGEVRIDLNNFVGTLRVKDPNFIDETDDTLDDGDDDDMSVEVEVVAPPLVPESKAGKRFEIMLSDFREHSEADINLVPSPRYRGLLTGTSAAINDPKVTRAFKVLYEDLGPVRVAGDLLFSKLNGELSKSKVSDGAVNVRALGRDDSCVIAARKIFDAVDADASGTVSSQELLDSDLLRSLGQCVECTCGKEGSCQSVMRFMDDIDKTHPQGELHFDEFLLAAHKLYEGDASVSLFGGDDSAEELVDEILNGNEGEIGQEKVDRYSKRFDNMCAEFDSWDTDDSSTKAESKNPRLALVLDGCFAGSKNPPVVDALKILYIDFRPLRMAGDLIFKMMRKLAT